MNLQVFYLFHFFDECKFILVSLAKDCESNLYSLMEHIKEQ